MLLSVLIFTSCSINIDFSPIATQPVSTEAVTEKPKKVSSAEIRSPFKPVTLHYGYDTLTSSAEQRLYTAFVDGCYSLTNILNDESKYKKYEIEPIILENCVLTREQVAHIYEAVELDHPELFWIDSAYTYIKTGERFELNLFSWISKNDFKKYNKKFIKAVNTALSGLDKKMSAMKRELYLHDYIVDSCKYDYKISDGKIAPYTPYGCLVRKNAVCEGYTSAFQLLLKYAGVEAVTVKGADVDKPDTNHIWNAVKLKEDWVYTDITWDDADGKLSRYSYFNITLSQLMKTHLISDMFYDFKDDGSPRYVNLIIPEADNDEYNYYVNYACDVRDISDNAINEDLVKTAEEHKDVFYIYINPSYLSFQTAYNQLFSDELYGFAEYIRRANNALGYDALSTSTRVSKNAPLSVIAVELQYN